MQVVRKPRFNPGEDVCGTKILEYVGRDIKPGEHDPKRIYHWYKARCKCGNIFRVDQYTLCTVARLNKTKNRQANCPSCNGKALNRGFSAGGHNTDMDDGSDFSLLRKIICTPVVVDFGYTDKRCCDS